MGVLTKDEILSRGAPRTEEIEVPAWGGSVFVRQLGIVERIAFQQAGAEGPGDNSLWVRLALLAVCDADGARLFTDEDLATLCEMDGAALEPVVEAAMRLNGFLTPAEREEKKAG